MALYRYKAAHSNGKVQRGTLEATHINDMSVQLKNRDLTLITCAPVRKSFLRHFETIKPHDLIEMCVHLSHLQKAGVPLLESLYDVSKSTTNKPLQDRLISICRDLEGGLSFSEALAKHARLFDSVFVGLMRVAEKTGDMSFALEHSMRHLKWVEDTHEKTWKALRYPLFVSLMMIGVLSTLMVLLVPELVGFLTSFGGELPTSTRTLIAVSTWAADYGALLLLALVGAGIGVYALHLTMPQSRYWIDRASMFLPVLGALRQKIALARWSHFTAIMFQSGVGLLESLTSAKEVMGHHVLSQEMEHVSGYIEEGKTLSQAMEHSPYFPPLVLRMVKIGEEAGSLDQTLLHVNEYYERSMRQAVDRAIGVIEPAMLILAGSVLAWIIYSVFLPLYDTMTILDY